MTQPGLFLSLDGIDGTGKSTQCRLLIDWLLESGYPVVQAIDPGGTALGQKLRSILLEGRDDMALRAEALLFMASRAELVERIIRPALELGSVVVADRYLLANVVYQGHAGRLPVDELWRLGHFATQGIMPQCTLILDLPVDEAVLRRGRAADRVEQRDLAYHERVRQGFLLEAGRQPGCVVLDASGTIEEIQTMIRAELLPRLAKVSQGVR